MDEEVFNLSLRKFLKMVGVSSQREIEQAVARAVQERAIAGTESFPARMTLEIAGTESVPARMTLEIAGLKLRAEFDGEIRLQ